MSKEDLNSIIEELQNNVKPGDVYYANNKLKKQFNTVIQESINLFLDEPEKLMRLKRKVIDRSHGPFGSDILNVCKTIKSLLDKKIEKELKGNKIFLEPSDLIKKAGIALRQGNEAYAIHLCDSAIEVFLKEAFDIPSTIVGSGSVKFLSECMILNIPKGMNLYLQETKNKVCQMNNQIKHKGYIPSRLDAINAIKVTEELFLRKSRFKDLTLEEKKKVQIGVGVIQK